MSTFLNPLRYENLDGSKLRLLEPFTYHVGSEFSSEKIEVPAGFKYDAQSMPHLFWMIDPPQGSGAKAGFIHDYLYWLNGRIMPKTGIEYNRVRSDLIYREALEISGLQSWRCAVRYWALRLFGWAAWKAHGIRIQRELMELEKAQEKLQELQKSETVNDQEKFETETQIFRKVEELKNGETVIPVKASP